MIPLNLVIYFEHKIMSIQINNLPASNSKQLVELTVSEAIAINGGRSVANDGGANEPTIALPRWQKVITSPPIVFPKCSPIVIFPKCPTKPKK